MPPLPAFVQQRLPGSAEVEIPISVDVIRMHLIREAIEIEMHPDNINRDGGFKLSRSWKPLLSGCISSEKPSK